MIDHKVRGQQRIGERRVRAHCLERVTHRGEIDDARHASEILQQHAGRHEADLFGVGAPTARDLFDVLRRNFAPVFMPQQIFEQDLDRERQARDIAFTSFFQLCQPEDLIRGITHAQRSRRPE